MHITRAFWMFILSAGLLIACESPTGGIDEDPAKTYLGTMQSSQPKAEAGHVTLQSAQASDTHRGLATLRKATAQYHRSQAALDDGFVPVASCVENPDGPGALGIPYLNPDRLDATIDLENPEVLFYEPQKNGRLRLVGVENVVPIELWDGSEPPSLFGQKFHRNDDAGLFGRHIWIWRHNPDGMFAFWHRDVTCDYAG